MSILLWLVNSAIVVVIVIGLLFAAAAGIALVITLTNKSYRVPWLKRAGMRAERAVLPLGAVMAICIFIMMSLGGCMKLMVRHEIRSFVSEHGTQVQVWPGNLVVDNSDTLLSALADIHGAWRGKSAVAAEGFLELHARDGSTKRLVLRKDAAVPGEYRVFYPEFYFTNLNDVGRIRLENELVSKE